MDDDPKRDGADEASRRIEEVQRSGLPQLDLSNLELVEVPPALQQIDNIKALDLSFNELTEFLVPPKLRRHISHLSLCGNQLQELSESIGDCRGLQFLDVHENNLRELPDAVGRLSNLRQFNAANNQLRSLPNTIKSLAILEELDLSRNQIETIEPLQYLVRLRYLYMLTNELSGSAPEWIGGLESLKRLSFADNHLQALPDSLGNLRNLTALYLSNNKITFIPDTVCQLRELHDLYLDGNRLERIPDNIGQLQELRQINIDHNQICTLPDSIGELSSLRVLEANNNCLRNIPTSIGRLSGLRTLNICENPIADLPAEIAATLSPEKIVKYLSHARWDPRPLMEAKLILVGRGGVGKTSLVNRLLYDKFDADEPETEGISISPWAIELPNGEQARLHVWDFGGQDILHATHQFFLTYRTLYILVLSGREGSEDRDAHYWLNLIATLASGSPVIIVLNKCKEYPFDVNRRNLQDKFGNISCFITTDCEDSTGIFDLKRSIVNETNGLKDLRVSFPASWFQIKNRLADMKENYLEYVQYREICQKLGESSHDAQDSLASVLHDLGIVLNYRDNPRLRDTHVLNPRWVTTGIYRILKDPDVAARHGELRLDDLAIILDPREYPLKTQHFLVDLMRKFELCIRFPYEDAEHYLVPDLLDKQEPADTNQFIDDNSLAFEYHYRVLPDGLLPRFITRTYVHSHDQPRWRTGVVLQFEGNCALIRGDLLDNRVRIFVTGSDGAGRRRLLAVIRSHFEEIHRSYSFDEPSAMVPVPDCPGLVIEYAKLLAFEKEGIFYFKEYFASSVVVLDVRNLLNGIDLELARSPVPPPVLRVFYSYSHKDERLRDELRTHLRLFERRNLIQQWDDREILPGMDWQAEIDENLERADIILLLISAAFFDSDYCWGREMAYALKRHEEGKAQVIPIIVRNCKWDWAPFAKLEALPVNGRAVRSWPDRDEAWKNVADRLEEIIHLMSEKKDR